MIKLWTVKSVGLEINDRRVNVVRVISQYGRVKLVAVGSAELPQGAVVRGELLDAGVVAKVLQEAAETASPKKIDLRQVAFVVSSKQVYTEMIDVQGGQEVLPENILGEAEGVVPIETNDLVLGYQVTGSGKKKDSSRVLLIGSSRKKMLVWLDFFQAQNISVVSWDSTAVAVRRGLFAGWPKKPVGVVWGGNGQMTLGVYYGKGEVRSFPVKGVVDLKNILDRVQGKYSVTLSGLRLVSDIGVDAELVENIKQAVGEIPVQVSKNAVYDAAIGAAKRRLVSSSENEPAFRVAKVERNEITRPVKLEKKQMISRPTDSSRVQRNKIILIVILVVGAVVLAVAFWWRQSKREERKQELSEQIVVYSQVQSINVILPVELEVSNYGPDSVRGRLYKDEVEAGSYTEAVANSRREVEEELDEEEELWLEPLNPPKNQDEVNFPLEIIWLIYSDIDVTNLLKQSVARMNMNNIDFEYSEISVDGVVRTGEESYVLDGSVTLSLNELIPVEEQEQVVEFVPEVEEEQAVERFVVVKETPTGFLNVRLRPDASEILLGQVKPGDKLKLVEESEDGTWYNVVWQDEEKGWVLAFYTDLESPDSEEE